MNTMTEPEIAGAPKTPGVESGPRPRSALGRTRVLHAFMLVGILIALEALVFRPYFDGESIPPWDFLGSYNTDAYSWWTQGSFFSPPEWISSVWGGYPAALVLQNSGWYLPVGMVSFFVPFSLHASAALSALHVAFGFLGAYALARGLKLRFLPATLVAVAWFFAVGYYSNAEHVDIVRGYSWIPWVLLVLSPKWPWRRWWSIPIAVLVLWQAITGTYPGMVIAMAYVGIVCVVAWQLSSRVHWREYLLPLAVSIASAALLCAPRLLPYLSFPADAASGLAESSVFSPDLIGTLLFGYGAPSLPNDISMRSFFVPAAALALAFFARWRDPATKLAAAIGVPALVLGMPFFPWATLAQSLPGLGLSRFGMSDFKPFLILSVVLLAASGLSMLTSRTRDRFWSARILWPLAAALVFLILMVLIARSGPYVRADYVPQLIMLTVGLGLVSVLLVVPRVKLVAAAIAVGLIALTAVSGVAWANDNSATWRAPRLPTEQATYGSTVHALIDSRVVQKEHVQRPARMPLRQGFTVDDLFTVSWNRVYYTGELAIGGYINLKGSRTQHLLTDALLDKSTGTDFASFLTMPGTILTVPRTEDPTAEDLHACVSGETCGAGNIHPISYQSGELVYRVETAVDVRAEFNEAFFTGWQASVCLEDGSCRSIETRSSNTGLVEADLPSGSYTVKLAYHSPQGTTAWGAFWLGCALCVGGMTWVLFRRKPEMGKVSKE
ncbi:hypothetical protein E3O44_00320 [Cryobacterium algoricola]|uniref:YfhO family protein n=1 Tax=Cryobacterium algoricola TaxID=1259183 RepID=A0ABY2IHH8_9MICO|nr:hypothetical protein [Cryobacterium algoricola]TFB91274.1 hypothetical protein E3O44_00320 [Cryobacterium algoricola]